MLKYDLSQVSLMMILIYWWSYFITKEIIYCVGLVLLRFFVDKMRVNYYMNWMAWSIIVMEDCGVLVDVLNGDDVFDVFCVFEFKDY